MSSIFCIGKAIDFEEREEGSDSYSSEGKEKRPANAPLVMIDDASLQLSPEDSSRRCNRKEGRGSVYNSICGICCHFCRQKTLCAEKDCKRCGNLDVNQPCIGKTDCSVCHSSNGVLCRACLKIRYGEVLHSSLCLKNRKMTPTGIAIYRGIVLN
ncbi:hypothetical protein Golob_016255 [Gossypium lobatum]|uniref:Zinc-finger domain-containing protein n=1 Tax=Gossypium lobatum TaxID=34289 RepID=A0A7J8M3J8_9ROSI|nr:hypothetical protein [Gossypium lobatum]